MPEDKILDRVRALINKADDPAATEAERDTYLQKADSLMLKYAIDQALLDANKNDDRRTPVSRRIRVFDIDSPWDSKFQTILSEIGRSTRSNVATHYDGSVTVVGMGEDVDYFELLWTSVFLGFVSRLEPRWDNALGFDLNVYNLKMAGMKWSRIAEIANASNNYVPWPDGGLLIRAYKRHCKMIGETPIPHTQRNAAYRESFAEGYVRSVCSRLEGLREKAEESTRGSGAELALRSVEDVINEAFWNEFPHLRPLTEEEREALRESLRARQAKEQEELAARLAAMTPRERRTYDREQERKRQKNARENERYWRQSLKEMNSKHDSLGMQAGRKAGEQVDFYDSTGVGAASRKEIG